MQSLQMKPKLNWLFKLVCSKYMKDTCIEKSEIKNIGISKEYSHLFQPNYKHLSI